MHTNRCRTVCFAYAAFLVLLAGTGPLAAETPRLMKAGFAEADITPKIGMEQPGGYGKSYHRSFHDPCKVRAAVLDDGQRRVAIVGIDGLAVHREMVQDARKAIAAANGHPRRSHPHLRVAFALFRAALRRAARRIRSCLAAGAKVGLRPIHAGRCGILRPRTGADRRRGLPGRCVARRGPLRGRPRQRRRTYRSTAAST